MPYTLIKKGAIAIALWTRPELPDTQKLIDDLVAFKNELGHAPVFISLVPPDGDPPDAPTRQAMSRRFNELLSVIDADQMYAVFEGDLLRQRLNRTVLRGMIMVARLKQTVRILGSLPEALELIGARGHVGRDLVLRAVDEARARLKTSAAGAR